MGAFQDAGDSMINQVRAGLDAFADIIMEDSLQQCPVETGTLRRSARIYHGYGNMPARGSNGRFQKETSVTIGYGFGDEINPKTRRPAADYAAAVHEIVEAYHKPPTKAKFLEDPVFSHASMMEPLLASYMKEGVRPGAPFSIGAVIGAAAEMVGKNAGAMPPGALDAGDHLRGTPHE